MAIKRTTMWCAECVSASHDYPDCPEDDDAPTPDVAAQIRELRPLRVWSTPSPRAATGRYWWWECRLCGHATKDLIPAAELAYDDAFGHLNVVHAEQGADFVWQLEHDGYGTTIHASSYHAQDWAENREPGGDTYWRYDDGTHWLKRHGETIATIRPVEVLGAGTAKEESDDG